MVRGKPVRAQVGMRNLKDDEIVAVWSKHRTQGLNWLLSQFDSVFVVTLESLGTVHSIAVDTRPWRRIIVDSQECYALRLATGMLIYCGGGIGTHIRAIRRVFWDA